MTRKTFLQTILAAAASGIAATPRTEAQAAKSSSQSRRVDEPAPRARIKRGVTLYSYQEEYFTRAMTLEDCIAEVASMQAEGVELIAEEMVPNYPDPPEAWVEQWHRLLAKYRTRPTCMDTFVDTMWGGHRQMSVAEAVDTLGTQMRLCSRLGFKVMRPTTGPVESSATDMIMRALPLAEKYDVKIAPEIHSPIRLKSKYIDDYMELISKTGTKHCGFTLDMGIFARRTPRVAKEHYLRRGVRESVADYVCKAFEQDLGPEKTVAEVGRMGGNEAEKEFAFIAYIFGPVTNSAKDLAPIVPYIYNVHGKFYEMTEELKEYSIPYEEIVPALREAGYSGYINSEYEGQRLTQDAFETDSCEQVRRHHVMLRRLLGEI